MDILNSFRKELTSLKVGDLVKDVFTREIGIVMEIYDLDYDQEIYRVYIQNPRDGTAPTVTYSKRSLWVLIDLLAEKINDDEE